MTTIDTLSPEAREDLVRRAWYSHDARWYMLVAQEFGFETANRLNRAAVRAMGEVEAARLAKAARIAPSPVLDEFLAFVEAGRHLYVAPPLIDMNVVKNGEREYAIEVTRCFVAENITRAGIAPHYECAVFDRVQAWHNALGLPLVDDIPPTRCAKAEGRECRRTMTMKEAAE